MIPNPIRKVLSTIREFQVRALLMGGQACVFYGAAEFSRDTDLVILCEDDNLGRLQKALDALDAVVIAVPPFDAEYLRRGHAVHFRCGHRDAEGLRIDIMASMRGVAPFEELWTRRTTIEVSGDEVYELLSLPDLVQAKKTQRDKDWPMLRRLLEAHYFNHRDEPTDERLAFWFCELRTPELLQELAAAHPQTLDELRGQRTVLDVVKEGESAIAAALRAEEDEIRAADRAYWQPLRKELELLRRRSAR